jgi:DNA-binding MarR family transcriptional regulator
MNDSRAGDTARVLNALRRSVRALRSANVSAKRGLGVGAAQLFVLRQIADAPGLSLVELAARTHTAQSSVSEVVSRLVQEGYIRKTHAADDRRRLALELTARGESVTRDAGRPVQEQLIEGLAKLPAHDQRRLADLYEAWLTAAGLDVVPASMFFEPVRRRSGSRSKQPL